MKKKKKKLWKVKPIKTELTIDSANDITGIPVHIGIIMDGNGRWATARKLPRSNGHKEGLNAAREIIKEAAKLGIKYLTLYTFSTENWKRTQEEVGFLMNLLKTHLRKEFEFYKKERVRLLCLGDLDGLPKDINSEILSVMKDSENFNRMNLVLAINYGGKDEITRGVKKFIKSNSDIDSLSIESLASYFDIPELPPVDLIIRTGGEKRLSNFLMWQSAYAELEFSDILWPDYTADNFRTDVSNFLHRNRRFGGEK